MAKSNLEAFKQFVEKDPNNSFARYSLAMEYRKAGQLNAALATFEELIVRDPNYLATYLMAAQVALDLDRIERAREIIAQGTEIARTLNNQHAASELASLLDSVG